MLWGRGMQPYRIYIMDRWSGHIRSYVDFEAGSDEIASSAAESYRGEDPIELWSGRLKLRHFPAIDEI